MMSKDDIQALVDEFCDPCMRCMEWTKPGSFCLHNDMESQRRVGLSADRDWVREFERALASCWEDISSVKVELPMSPTGHDGPYGSGSWYWTDFDAEVFSMLRSRGADLSFPRPYQGEYFNSHLIWFYLFCPPGISELLLEDHGVSVCDIDFSDSIMGMSVTMALKISGNERAFRWLRENRPEALNMGQIKLQELADTPLLIPLLEDKKDGSLGSPKLYDSLKDMVAQGRLREATALAPKLKLTEAKINELLALAEERSSSEDAFFVQLVAGLEERLSAAVSARRPAAGRKKQLSWNAKRINEFVSFAEHGDVASMAEYLENVGGGKLPEGEGEIASKARKRLWYACLNNLDVALLEFLASRGLSLQEIDDVPGMPIVSQVIFLPCMLQPSSDVLVSARAFLMKLLDEGARCEEIDPDHASDFLRSFPGDYELFDGLRASGLSFHCDSGYEEGEDDALIIQEVIECCNERDAGWEDVAYLLNHGTILTGTSDWADDVWREFEENPGKTAAMVESIPPNVISPAARLLPAVAASGSVQALMALELWDGVYEDAVIDVAIERASSEGLTEAVAYLLEKKDAIGNASALLSLDDGDMSPELAEAIGRCAVTRDLALRDCDLLPSEDGLIIVPEGVVAIEDGAFAYTLEERSFVSIPDSVFRYPKPNKIESVRTLSLPESAEPLFEEVFICSNVRELFVRGNGGLIRAMIHPDISMSFAGFRIEGDSRSVVNKIWEGVERNYEDGRPVGGDSAGYAMYLSNIDKLFEEKALKNYVNRSRLAVCRLIDQSFLSEEHRVMYEKFLKRNASKCEEYFAERDMRMFSEMLPAAIASIGR